MPDTTTIDATPSNDGSLDAASQRIVGLLSDSSEDPQKTTDAAGADSTKDQTATESKLADAAPDTTEEKSEAKVESEQSESKDAKEEATAETEKPQTYKTRIRGEEVEVTLDELLKGYSRTQDYTLKTQELAEARRKFEAEDQQAVRAEREQYKSYLGELKSALEVMTPKEPNWDKLKNELTPEAFAAEVLSWQQRQKQIETLDAEQKRVQAAQDADARKGFEEFLKSEQVKLEAKLPDMKDPEKAKVIKKDLVEFATVRMGFTPEELQQATDHRLVLLLHMAMRHDQAEKNAPKIQNKIEKAMDSSPPGSRVTPKKSDPLDAAMTRLKKSGSLEDARDALLNVL